MSRLVIVEVSRKQEYIFASNRVKENVGASNIIEHVTNKLTVQEMEKNNGSKLLAGGGKSIFQFQKTDDALIFAKEVTGTVIKEFPGVELFVAMTDFDNEKEKIRDVIDLLYKELEKKKNRRANTVGIIGLGIEKICQSTGKVAVKKSGEAFIASDIRVKEKCAEDANETYGEIIGKKYKLTTAIDKLINKGSDKSFIAVVHIDGNQMGDKFKKLKKHFKESEFKEDRNENEKYKKELRKLSDDIDKAYKESFREMCEVIAYNEEEIKEETNISERIFPLRPLILAGDDITYIANGKIGVESARIFIEKLNKKTVKIGTEEIQLNACAGVSLVKLKYPFFKAYQLAEELCANGKKTILRNNDGDCSMIDWHIEYGEIADSLEEIRKKCYTISGSDNNDVTLNMRPLYINNNLHGKFNTYSNFKEVLKAATSEDLPRNKVKKLREVLLSGKEETEKFMKMSGLNESMNPRIEGTIENFGFDKKGKVCMYYDAIEIMDVFQELREEGELF